MNKGRKGCSQRKKTTMYDDDVTIDELGVAHSLDDGSRVRVTWGDLVRVALITVAQGPFAEDLFFVLDDREGRRCMLPGARAAELLPRLQRLRGFDNGQVQRAADCLDDDAHFVCWNGRPGEALVCA
jgi:hypothetical protein